jgi:uncharacterized protein (DUF302 family)
MRNFLLALVLIGFAPISWALSPYFQGSKVAAGDVQTVIAQVEGKLTKAGFSIVGKYAPAGLTGSGVLVVTEKGLLEAVRKLGGINIVGAPIRIGVKADGSVSYMNMEYWLRAYFRKQYPQAEKTVKATQSKLSKALGAGKAFGGDVERKDLPEYQYMFGMEGFESDKNVLIEHLTFEDAVKTIQENSGAWRRQNQQSVRDRHAGQANCRLRGCDERSQGRRGLVGQDGGRRQHCCIAV